MLKMLTNTLRMLNLNSFSHHLIWRRPSAAGRRVNMGGNRDAGRAGRPGAGEVAVRAREGRGGAARAGVGGGGGFMGGGAGERE